MPAVFAAIVGIGAGFASRSWATAPFARTTDSTTRTFKVCFIAATRQYVTTTLTCPDAPGAHTHRGSGLA